MKRHTAILVVIALSLGVVPASRAQSGGMGGMGMKDMGMMGKEQTSKVPKKVSQAKLHKGVGMVTAVDTANGTVTIAHDPIQTLNWSAMSMTFGVKDKSLFEKLSTGKKVEFEFIQRGPDYTITSAKKTD